MKYAPRPLTGISVEVRNLQTHSVVSSSTTGRHGAVAFRDLPLGRYEVTVAGGILPPRRDAQVDASDSHVALQLPLSQPNEGSGETVSIQQFTVPRKARAVLNAATEAWKKVREQATRALALHLNYGAALSVLGFLDLQDGSLEVTCANLKAPLTTP